MKKKKIGLKSWLEEPQFIFPFADDEIVVDLFAGGGGASVGLEMAMGRPVDVAINHNPVALAIHEVNHPTTLHLSSDVWEVDPRLVARGREVKVAWFSPDCTHFSRAKGGTPVEKNIRSLAWVVVEWIDKVAPEVIGVENVPELMEWGPLIQAIDAKGNPKHQKDGRPYMIPDPKRKGETFRAWIEAIESHGYSVEYRTLRASDYGAPTSRERLFIVARRDGQPIIWPNPTHGPASSPEVISGRLKPWVAAHTIIDWKIITPSIFMSKEEGKEQGLKLRRPLADATLRRVAKGVLRYVLQTENPFIIHTVDTGIGTSGPAAAHIAKHYTGITGQDIREPLSTITAVDHHGLVVSRLAGIPKRVAAFGMKFYGTGGQWQDLRDPLHTITSKARLSLAECEIPLPAEATEEQRYRAWWVARFMEEYANIDTAGIGLVPEPRPSFLQVNGHYMLVDIGMRMLDPKELFRGQGFPEDYIFDRDKNGKPFTKTAQIAACGNSVPPIMVKAVIKPQLDSISREGEMPATMTRPSAPVAGVQPTG